MTRFAIVGFGDNSARKWQISAIPRPIRNCGIFPYLAVLALTACGPTTPVISTPPPERFAPVAEPQVPAGDSDAEVSGYIVSLIDALRQANDKLAWLDDWRKGVTKP